MKFRTVRAFTLVELVVTIAAVGVVAAVGVIAYNSFVSRSQDSVAADANAKLARTAVAAAVGSTLTQEAPFWAAVGEAERDMAFAQKSPVVVLPDATTQVSSRGEFSVASTASRESTLALATLSESGSCVMSLSEDSALVDWVALPPSGDAFLAPDGSSVECSSQNVFEVLSVPYLPSQFTAPSSDGSAPAAAAVLMSPQLNSVTASGSDLVVSFTQPGEVVPAWYTLYQMSADAPHLLYTRLASSPDWSAYGAVVARGTGEVSSLTSVNATNAVDGATGGSWAQEYVLLACTSDISDADGDGTVGPYDCRLDAVSGPQYALSGSTSVASAVRSWGGAFKGCYVASGSDYVSYLAVPYPAGWNASAARDISLTVGGVTKTAYGVLPGQVARFAYTSPSANFLTGKSYRVQFKEGSTVVSDSGNKVNMAAASVCDTELTFTPSTVVDAS